MVVVTNSWRLLDLRSVPDRRGSLAVAESGRDIPFTIERAFWIYDVPEDQVRAGHALVNCEQVLIPVSGGFDVHIDDGWNQQTVTLDRPDQALYLSPMTWREIDRFPAGSVCLVLASTRYEDTVYYRSRDLWQRVVSAT